MVFVLVTPEFVFACLSLVSYIFGIVYDVDQFKFLP